MEKRSCLIDGKLSKEEADKVPRNPGQRLEEGAVMCEGRADKGIASACMLEGIFPRLSKDSAALRCQLKYDVSSPPQGWPGGGVSLMTCEIKVKGRYFCFIVCKNEMSVFDFC